MTPQVDANESRLLDAIYASPSDDGARLAYADLLLERGEPLGEYVQLQVTRAAKGFRSKSREQRLFKQESRRWPRESRWWWDSPCRFGREYSHELKWEHTVRGFPVVFDPAPTSHKDEANAELERLSGHPALNLVEELHLWDWWARPAVRSVLDGSSWSSLRAVNLASALLEDVAKRAIARRISDLHILQAADLATLRELSPFTVLRRLIIFCDLEIGRLCETVSRARPPSTLESLHVPIHVRDVRQSLSAVMAAFKTLPESVSLLDAQTYELRGEHRQPDLRVAATHDLEHAAAELEAMPTTALRSVQIDVTVLPVKQRAEAKSRMLEATRKWSDRTTFGSYERWWGF